MTDVERRVISEDAPGATTAAPRTAKPPMNAALRRGTIRRPLTRNAHRSPDDCSEFTRRRDRVVPDDPSIVYLVAELRKVGRASLSFVSWSSVFGLEARGGRIGRGYRERGQGHVTATGVDTRLVAAHIADLHVIVHEAVQCPAANTNSGERSTTSSVQSAKRNARRRFVRCRRGTRRSRRPRDLGESPRLSLLASAFVAPEQGRSVTLESGETCSYALVRMLRLGVKPPERTTQSPDSPIGWSHRVVSLMLQPGPPRRASPEARRGCAARTASPQRRVRG